LGITVRELDKLVEVYQLSEHFSGLREPGAGITWARELHGLAKNLVTPSVVNAVVEKVNAKRITNSKDLRELRKILRDPVAKRHFLTQDGDMQSAMLRIAAEKPKFNGGLVGDIESLTELMKKYPWTDLQKLKGEKEALRKIEDARKVLNELKDALS